MIRTTCHRQTMLVYSSHVSHGRTTLDSGWSKIVLYSNLWGRRSCRSKVYSNLGRVNRCDSRQGIGAFGRCSIDHGICCRDSRTCTLLGRKRMNSYEKIVSLLFWALVKSACFILSSVDTPQCFGFILQHTKLKHTDSKSPDGIGRCCLHIRDRPFLNVNFDFR